MTYQLVKGWWAIQDAVQWKVPMFELTEDLIKKVDDDDVYEFADGTKGFSLGRKSYFVKETKDELKTYIIGQLFKKADYVDTLIAQHMQVKLDIRESIDVIAGA